MLLAPLPVPRCPWGARLLWTSARRAMLAIPIKFEAEDITNGTHILAVLDVP